MYYFNFYSDYIEDRKENKKQRLNLVHPTLINRSFKIQNRENENEEMIKGILQKNFSEDKGLQIKRTYPLWQMKSLSFVRSF